MTSARIPRWFCIMAIAGVLMVFRSVQSWRCMTVGTKSDSLHFQGWQHLVATPGEATTTLAGDLSNPVLPRVDEASGVVAPSTATGVAVNSVNGSSVAHSPRPLVAQREKNELTIATKHSCYQRRTCPHGRVNRIMVSPTNRAGLNDRLFIFEFMVNLAGYLCAEVEVKGPNEYLLPEHNNGQELHPELTWEHEFVSFQFYGDYAPAMKTVKQLDSNYQHRLSSLEDGHLVEHFRQAQSMYENETIFLWEWKPMKYHAALRTINTYLATLQHNDTTLPSFLGRPGCQYAYRESPKHLIALADSIWRDIVKEMGAHVIAGYFHVRRGDAVNECDTSLPRMDRFLACSLNGTESLGSIAILFSSDETSKSYRSAIENLVNEKRGSIRFFDLDARCYSRLREEIQHSRAPHWRLNNYYLFALINEIVKKVHFRLEQRRMFCANCADVRTEILENFRTRQVGT